MKHATVERLQEIEDFVGRIRCLPGLVEKKPGIFYRKGRAFLHFHDDPSGFYVDVRLNDEFERYRVATPDEQADLLARISAASAGPPDAK